MQGGLRAAPRTSIEVDQPETARPTALPAQPTRATATPSVDGAEPPTNARSRRRTAQPCPLREAAQAQKAARIRGMAARSHCVSRDDGLA